MRVLDLGQAVIHDGLAFGILIELREALRSSALLTDLLLESHRLGVEVEVFGVLVRGIRHLGDGAVAPAVHHHAARAGDYASHIAQVSGVLAPAPD